MNLAQVVNYIVIFGLLTITEIIESFRTSDDLCHWQEDRLLVKITQDFFLRNSNLEVKAMINICQSQPSLRRMRKTDFTLVLKLNSRESSRKLWKVTLGLPHELLNFWESKPGSGEIWILKKLLEQLLKFLLPNLLSYALRKAEKDRWTLLKSVHIHAKHLVTYEVRTYYRFLNFHNLTQSTLETYLEYIQRNLPEGTAMKATKVEIQKLPEHLQQM